jgi:hypothetical protein
LVNLLSYNLNPPSLWRYIPSQQLNKGSGVTEAQARSQLHHLHHNHYTQDCSINGWKSVPLHLHLLHILQR